MDKMADITDMAVETAINLLTSVIRAEISFIANLSDDVRAIEDELRIISGRLKTLEKRAVEDEDTKVWVERVRNLAHEIEDVIEEHQLFEKERSVCRKATYYFSLRFRGIKAIKSIREKAHNIIIIGEPSNNNNNHVNNVVEQAGAYSAQITTTYDADEPFELVGVDIARREILDLLGVTDQVGHTIRRPTTTTVAVVGMLGLGKTAIVRSVYNDRAIRDCFPMRAWISMSRTYSRLEVLSSMARQFCQATNSEKVSCCFKNLAARANDIHWVNSMDRGTLKDLVKKFLVDERYLIVFDDVQDKKNVEKMVTYVKHLLHTSSNKDNKILVTTRFEDVAQAWLDKSSHNLYRLKPLPLLIAESLFFKKAFQQYEGRCPSQQLKGLARKIVQKCEGLPLAILAVGDLLSSKSNDLAEWQKVHDNLGFYLEKDRHLTRIYETLICSYYDLPSHLKPCILYFGLFPKGFLVGRMRLIRLWIAEGFITKGRDNLTLEEVAEEYLNELINMSLVEVGCRDPTERPKTLHVHAFFHEIILSKVYELDFCQILSEESCIKNEKPRRLSIHTLKDDDKNVREFSKSIAKDRSSIRCVLTFDQTLDMLTKVISTTFLKKVYLLKVLDFSKSTLEVREHSDGHWVVPEVVGELRNLRYISLRNRPVENLPSSIGKLQDLQTLDLKNTCIHKLPLEINGLSKLRHLFTYIYEPDFTFSSHISRVRGVDMPQGALGNFGDLQKLAFIDLGNGTRLTKELRNLRRLGITGLKSKDGKDLCTAIKEMKHLQALNVYSYTKSETIDLEEFQSSSPPPPHELKHLYLNGPLKSSSNLRWIFDLHNLVKIRLRWSNLHDFPMANLGTLPNLVELQLLEAYNGPFLEITNEGFKKLKILNLLDLHALECLVINVGALPLLEQLSIGESPKLLMPSGIQNLLRLRTLHFFQMPTHFTNSIKPGEHFHSIVQHVMPNVFLQSKCNQYWKTDNL